MRFLFVLIFLVASFLVARCQNNDSLFIASALTKLKHSKEYTLQVAALMPAHQYGFRPTNEEMSFGEQLLHICSNLGWLSSSYLSTGVHPVSTEESKLQNKDSIRQVVIRTYDYAIAVLTRFSATNLSDTVQFFAGPMSKLQIINLLNDHQTHHRGQLLVYLRLCGVTPPRYVGW